MIVLRLARVETTLLLRSAAVLAGLVGGGALVWIVTRSAEPLWWTAGWQIAQGQVILAAAVLIAAHLAAGRASRDGLRDLYDSFPVSAGTRTMAHLASLIGVVPASVLLIGVATAWIQFNAAIGTPSAAVLAGGVLLVIAAGAAGIALGVRLPHPMAGVAGALVFFIVSLESFRLPGAIPWLFPWTDAGGLDQLPGPVTGYPPGAAHAVELAGIAILAAAVAIALTGSRGGHRRWLAGGTVMSVALIVAGGAVQLRPVPTADLNKLVQAVARPSTVQQCTTARNVRYCLYPAFGGQLSTLEAPVNAVLARLPARPASALTIAQAVDLSLSADDHLTHGHTSQQIVRWNAELGRAPVNAAPASAIYLPIGSWPARAGLADARLALALGAAEWAVHLPATALSPRQSCIPYDQAREAIALWLAITATHAHTTLGLVTGPRGQLGGAAAEVHHKMIFMWNDPGLSQGAVSQGLQFTANGYLLAVTMTRLPPAEVMRVLDGAWPRWLNWRTTDAQLEAALGIKAPTVSFPALPTNPPPGSRTVNTPIPPNPVCT